MLRVMKQMDEMVKRNIEAQFRDMNVTGPQGMLMGTLAHHGEMKVSDLSKILGLPNSTVSGMIDKLESQGLVERVRSKKDRRVVHVSVTAKFKDKIQNHFKEVERIFEEMLGRGTPEEIEAIVRGFETIEKLMNENRIAGDKGGRL